MTFLLRISLLAFIALISACSNQNSSFLNGLANLQIPVVQVRSVEVKLDDSNVDSIYLSNASEIDKLISHVKNKHLKVNGREAVFDFKSLSHKAYVALTNLERAREINALYFNERNVTGLISMQQALEPFITTYQHAR